MKTDLSKILSISGKHGLFLYLAQARGGAIVESLEDKTRTVVNAKNRITTLADISIYTEDGETKLREVFLKMRDALDGTQAPGPKSDPETLKEFFGKVLPDYDGSRFYVSHMKKVVEWYNELQAHATLDFTDPDEEEASEGEAEGQAAEDPANA